MEMTKIHVHTASDKATVSYARFMWESMRLLAARPDLLRLTVHAIGPTAAGAFADLPNAEGVQVQMHKDGDTGSTAHALCVEHALLYVNDGNIHVICDSDTVVVARGWDNLLRHKLINERIGIVGASYEDIGGYSSGSSTSQTYKKIPNATWMALSPLYSWKGLNAVPEKSANLPISNDQQSKIYNLPVGYSVLRDVAWQIPQFLFDNKIPCQAWKQLKGSGDAAVIIKGLENYHEEFHATAGIPFIVHQRGSLRHAYRSAKMSIRFYDAVDHYVAQEKKFDPRWSWERNLSDNIAEHQPELTANAAANDVKVGPGWFKGTIDGSVFWARNQPFNGIAHVDFKPEHQIHNLRLEGTCPKLSLSLPQTTEKPYVLTVRNLVFGPATLQTGKGAAVTIPRDACWMLVVDVDGVHRVN
jgi:hypothetical protein